jgi:hypothetical protein
MIMAHFGNGVGITTTLIALVSNAGPEDQAIVTAGATFYLFYCYRYWCALC